MLLDLLFHHLHKPKVPPLPPTVGDSGDKFHLVKLQQKVETKDLKLDIRSREEEDLFALLGFMLSAKVIT